jgi:hypothetical protein
MRVRDVRVKALLLIVGAVFASTLNLQLRLAPPVTLRAVPAPDVVHGFRDAVGDPALVPVSPQHSSGRQDTAPTTINVVFNSLRRDDDATAAAAVPVTVRDPTSADAVTSTPLPIGAATAPTPAAMPGRQSLTTTGAGREVPVPRPKPAAYRLPNSDDLVKYQRPAASTGSLHAKKEVAIIDFVVPNALPRNKRFQFVTAEEATPEWRSHKNYVQLSNDSSRPVVSSFTLMKSIFYAPSPEFRGKNDGYIMVAVLSCW